MLDGLALAEPLDHRRGLAEALEGLAEVAVARGDVAVAAGGAAPLATVLAWVRDEVPSRSSPGADL